MGFFDRQVWGRALLVAAALAVGAVCWLGCGGDDDNPANNNSNNSGNNNSNNNNGGGGDGLSETVSLGGLKWMKKNLNVETADSWCYNNSPDSCAKYGKLYTWSAAKAACQSVGMRLPTRKEWDALSDLAATEQKSVNYINGSDTMYYWLGAGTKLKSTSGWYGGGNGTDDFGFSALPGGYRGFGGYFSNVGSTGYWWTATEGSDGYAYRRRMYYYGNDVDENYDLINGNAFSARCVQD